MCRAPGHTHVRTCFRLPRFSLSRSLLPSLLTCLVEPRPSPHPPQTEDGAWQLKTHDEEATRQGRRHSDVHAFHYREHCDRPDDELEGELDPSPVVVVVLILVISDQRVDLLRPPFIGEPKQPSQQRPGGATPDRDERHCMGLGDAVVVVGGDNVGEEPGNVGAIADHEGGGAGTGERQVHGLGVALKEVVLIKCNIPQLGFGSVSRRGHFGGHRTPGTVDTGDIGHRGLWTPGT